MYTLPIWKLLALLLRGGQGIAVLATIFWLWVLVDCLTKEPSQGNDKVAWTLFILLVPFIGALIYYFVRRPERIKAASE
ncbi:MAG TPA: PLD nuclease N-terminal domain-containing protein [Ktedonobacteraceae bacterium]|nr:PLD nuclease N-terminal domain-containing protein [Ktedonobacteraceae bacterium]